VRRGRVRKTVLALCAFGVVIAQPANAQLLVDPLEVTLASGSSERVTASFSVTNASDNPVQATITRQDWDRAENGDNRFLAAGSTGNSCGGSLSVSPASIRVEPHSARIVRLSLDGATAPKKECWDIVFVEEIPQRSSARGNSLQYIFRTGVKVYGSPPGLRKDGAVENMAAETVPVAVAASSTPPKLVSAAPSATKRQIAVSFHNTGNTHLLAKGRLEFRRLDNTLASQVEIPEFPTLPGALRKISTDVPAGLIAGDYVVLALIDFGGAELVAGQIDFQAK
jgi:P pilus assembly chaperone PapD